MHKVMNFVLQFHEKYDLPIAASPKLPDKERVQLRMKLLEKAYHDYRYAERAGDILEIADAMGDMIYVLAGTATEYGIPLEDIFTELHRSNMTRGEPIMTQDGRLTKGPTYKKPELGRVLLENMYELF